MASKKWLTWQMALSVFTNNNILKFICKQPQFILGLFAYMYSPGMVILIQNLSVEYLLYEVFQLAVCG
jgi:hypothetical protein